MDAGRGEYGKMKMRIFVICLMCIFAAEAALLFFFSFRQGADGQDTVLVNEAVRSVQQGWNDMAHHENSTGLEYVVLDREGEVLFRTGPGLSESLNAAVRHRDTILDIQLNSETVGKILIYNNTLLLFRRQRESVIFFTGASMLLQCGLCMGYVMYLKRRVIRPFRRLKGFAERVAGGNLDIPLEMDRQNLFGAFTESFDLMRAELKKARQAEAEANAGKKELVAKLSHDIKTPVASIKAASEVGAAIAEQEKIRDNYRMIIQKADQINTLINNLFTATLEELQQLPVNPEDIRSEELATLLKNADYLHRAVIPAIPDCILYADRLRLQQVFDNLFANSYKYAGTRIMITVREDGGCLTVEMEDSGGGVGEDELPLLKEKFRRGSNAANVEGAGLGLYISDYFLKEMGGGLVVQNGEKGLRVSVRIALSGREVTLNSYTFPLAEQSVLRF
nr:HAMP domain-containing sensor histidine kinase [uncultured Acetatifactor sp.]